LRRAIEINLTKESSVPKYSPTFVLESRGIGIGILESEEVQLLS